MPNYKFIPSGFLDLTTEPTELPQQAGGRDVAAVDMVRCTNLTLDQPGKARTRPGSAQILDQSIPGVINHLVEHQGAFYSFSETAIFRDAVPLASGLASGDWDTFSYNAFNETQPQLFATNGTEKKRITITAVAGWGIQAPSVAPTLDGELDFVYVHDWELTDGHAAGSVFQLGQDSTDGVYRTVFDWEVSELDGTARDDEADGSRGTYWFETSPDSLDQVIGVRYTYVRKDGALIISESNPSPETEVNIESGLFVTWTASSDSQVTHVRLYRTQVGGAVHLFAEEVAVALGTTSIGLADRDSTLGTAVATDHDQVPDDVVALAGPDYNGVCFAAVRNRVYFSLPKQPEYWPSDAFVEVGPPEFPIKALSLFQGQLFVFTQHKIILLQGTGSTSFFPLGMQAMAGAIGKKAVVAVQGEGIFHLSSDGVYRWTGSQDTKVTDERFLPIWRGETVGSVPAVGTNVAKAFILYRDNRLWVFYPSAAETIPDNVLVTHLKDGKTVHYQYAGRSHYVGAVDVPGERLVVIGSSGFLWEIDNAQNTDDEGSAINWQIESKPYGQPLRRIFPRWAKYDVELVNDATATGTVLVDDASVQTHTIRSRETRKRLIDTSEGHRQAIRISGQGTATIRRQEIS
jgi:hypothetical protein